MMEGPGAESEEKREPASDIETAAVDSLKCLTQIGRLEKRTLPGNVANHDITCRQRHALGSPAALEKVDGDVRRVAATRSISV